MSLPASPPIYNSWAAMTAPIVRGDTGWRAYALQQGLLDAGYSVGSWGADGDFGTVTLSTLKAYQHTRGLVVDGIAGPATQGMLLTDAGHRTARVMPAIPDGLLRGLAEAEGAAMLAPTNPYTPPGAPPGVDCGPVQLRQLGPPFSIDGLREAFGPYTSFRNAAATLLSRANSYMLRRPSLSARRTIELAVLAHNWPAGADQFVRYGGLLSPDSEAVWTTKPGGGHYTEAEWAQVYVDRVCKYVVW